MQIFCIIFFAIVFNKQLYINKIILLLYKWTF